MGCRSSLRNRPGSRRWPRAGRGGAAAPSRQLPPLSPRPTCQHPLRRAAPRIRPAIDRPRLSCSWSCRTILPFHTVGQHVENPIVPRVHLLAIDEVRDEEVCVTANTLFLAVALFVTRRAVPLAARDRR